MSNLSYDKNAYQILQPLSPQGSGAIIKAIAKQFSPPIPCVIQCSWIQNLDYFERVANLLQTLGKFCQLPKFIEGFTTENRYYFVQEFIAGKSLEKYLEEENLFTPDQVIEFLKETLLILELLHQSEIIHGDLKPRNLIYTQQWVLVDFSSAYLANQTSPLVGDAQYAAPEQLQGQGNYGSDLYSLGIICWQLLTGLSPFDLLSDFLPRLNHITLKSILEKLIKPSVEERFQSASQVLESLQNAGLIKQQKSLASQLQPTRYSPYLSLEGHSGLFASINSLMFSPDGKILASGSEDKSLRLWDIQTGQEIGYLQGEKQPIKAVNFTKDGEYLVTGNNKGLIECWDIKNQKISQAFSGHTQSINALLFDDDGQLLTASSDKTVKRWNLETKEVISTYKGHILGILALATHNNLLATASQDRTIKLWEIDQEKPLGTLQKHTWPVKAIAFSPDGKILASGGDDNQIILWDVQTQQILRIISGHSWSVTDLAFSQKGDLLISGSWDKTLKIWQVATGQLLAILAGHSDCIYTLALHPVEPIIASAGKDKIIHLWRINE